MGKKILVITDFDSVGSGYKHVCTPLFTKLAEMGHDIKVAGMMYRGEENWFPFSVIPAQNVQEAVGICTNLIQLWEPDIVLVALDLPIQKNLYNKLAPMFTRKKDDTRPSIKYIAITPLENGPLTMSWAIPLFQMDAVFFISELGKREAEKVGLSNVEHLRVGIDTASWHPATPEEKFKLRDGLGIPQDAFVILTVADNQERKNLWAGVRATSLLKKVLNKPIRYVLVTRMENPYGWNLKDLVITEGVKDECIFFERGMSNKDLWGLYAASDVYLQPSKAEGLGLPVLDAMACGVPVVATDTGALHELLEDNRGILCPVAYSFTDVWGNSTRDMIDTIKLSDRLFNISGKTLEPDVDKSLEYVRERNWDAPAKHFDGVIRKLFNE